MNLIVLTETGIRDTQELAPSATMTLPLVRNGTHQHQPYYRLALAGPPFLAGASGEAVLVSGFPLTVAPLRRP
jgi:hypothetical protein